MIPKPLRLAIVWLALILFLGTASFGPQQTQHHLMPPLGTLAPWLSVSALAAIHMVLRKGSHVMEYAILAVLWFRAFRYRRRLGVGKASWAALALCLACAIVDEVHQASVPGRHGGVEDVVLDSLGAVAALLVVRSRKHVADTGLPSASPPPSGTVRLDERA